MNKKKIIVFTGSRADYGILKPLLELLKADKLIHLSVIASGSHFSQEHGLTYKFIEKDGFCIDEKIDMLLNSDNPVGICKSIGLGVIGYCDMLDRIKPDAIVLLGDRYEAFSMAIAAHVMRIHIIHIHGGECTIGAIDDAFRHSITKMSTLHFASTDTYRKRIVQLGENPVNVFNVGSLSVENIKKMNFFSKRELKKLIGVTFEKDTVLITYHPVTLDNNKAKEQIINLINSIDKFKTVQTIFTMANVDAEGKKINEIIKNYCFSNIGKAFCFETLGQKLYLSVMKNSKLILGNSSSGIIEAPSFKVPTVNIGDRQQGRVHASSVINCDTSEESITKSIKYALGKDFLEKIKKIRNPYFKANTALNILKIIKNYKFTHDLKKEFYTL